jgi:predicted metal-dependent hydrolase
MPIIQDEEFGKITVRRSAKSSSISVRVAPDGTLRASLPLYAPLFLVKRLLRSSRNDIRELLAKTQPHVSYVDGMQIGKSHTIVVRPTRGAATVTKHGQQIIVSLPSGVSLDELSQPIHDVVLAALRLEARSYLPKRLQYLAEKQGVHYQKVRFSHASSRWGSCSSNGTISLNIALMKLPFELIDYVIIHELAHTVHMNHSPEFWTLVAVGDPQYRLHRRALKNETPSI